MIHVSHRSWSGYNDELAWSAIWMYKATGQNTYRNEAKQFYIDAGNSAKTLFSWDEKNAGISVLLLEEDGGSQYRDHVNSYCDAFRGQLGDEGVACITEWGNNRYAANSAFVCLRVRFSRCIGSLSISMFLMIDKSDMMCGPISGTF